MFPDEFAHAVGPGNSFDKVATSTEGAARDCAVIEKAASGGFSGISKRKPDYYRFFLQV